ncbi:serine-arginine protein 55-like [Ochlerotatus camptorhynchus]|uniref:serine-arginine protein 55-like n=1 Tax=Ochlerotatus camptorhynchus TaxID=644619 RepID=UPI0031DC3F01
MGTRVYVGKLPSDVRERDVERFFKGFGRINDILLRKGYGFVEFDDHRDAEDAIYELNGEKLLGQRVVIESSRKPQRQTRRGDSRYRSPTRTRHRVIVENVSSRINWRDLKDYMRRAGEVTFADAHRDRQYEGVVEFASRYEMKRAIKMLDDTELNGRFIRLVEERRSSSRSSRSRSCSGSRSQSRSVESYRRSRSRSPSDSRSRTRSRSRSSSRSYRSRKSSERSANRSRYVSTKRRGEE